MWEMVKKSRKIVASVLEVDLHLLKVSKASSWIKELEEKLSEENTQKNRKLKSVKIKQKEHMRTH